MKRFMYFSIGVLCLAIASLIGFYVGSHRVEAQTPGVVIGYTSMDNLPQNASIMMQNGDVYWRNIGVAPNGTRYFQGTGPSYIGNFWISSPMSSESSTWGHCERAV